MKLFIAFICLFVCQQGCVLRAQASYNKPIEDDLLNEMYSFFTETLTKTYHISDEAELYKYFLNDFFTKKYASAKSKRPLLQIDFIKFEQINEKLKIRDKEHFYYFFEEVIFIEAVESMNDISKKLKEQYPKVPFCLVQQHDENRTRHEKAFFYCRGNSMYLNTADDTFYSKIAKLNYNFTFALREEKRMFGFVSMTNFCIALVQENARNEIELAIARKTIAVIFWKLLCIQENADLFCSSIDLDG